MACNIFEEESVINLGRVGAGVSICIDLDKIKKKHIAVGIRLLTRTPFLSLDKNGSPP